MYGLSQSAKENKMSKMELQPHQSSLCESRSHMFSQVQQQKKANEKKKKDAKAKEEAVKYGEEKKQCKSSPAFNKVEFVRDFLASRHTHLYCVFMKAVIPLFDKANILQKDASEAHLLLWILTEQLSDIFTKFLKPTAIVDEDFKSYPVHMISHKHVPAEK